MPPDFQQVIVEADAAHVTHGRQGKDDKTVGGDGPKQAGHEDRNDQQ